MDNLLGRISNLQPSALLVTKNYASGNTYTAFVNANSDTEGLNSLIAFLFDNIRMNEEDLDAFDQTYSDIKEDFNGTPFEGSTADSKDMILLTVSSISKVLKYYYDLVICNKAKDLSMKNVNSYWSANDMKLNTSKLLMNVIQYCSQKSMFTFNRGYVTLQSQYNPFLKYHTTVFSSANLALKLVDTFGQLGYRILGITEDRLNQVVENSHNLAYSNRITPTMRVKIYAYLAATNQLPTGWYQGEKAWSDHNSSEKSRWLKFFKAYFSAHTDIEYDPEVSLEEQLASAGIIPRD